MAGPAQVSPTRTQPLTAPAVEEPLDYLIVDVLYGRRRIDTVVSALEDGHGHRFLPLKRMASAVGYRLNVDPLLKTASGFLSQPRDRAALDAGSGTLTRKGIVTRFDPKLCFERENDLYVDSELFCQWTGLKMDWRMDRLELEVRSDTPLVIRKQGQPGNGLASPARASADFGPTVKAPYQFLTVPTLDFQLYTMADIGHDRDESTTVPSLEGVGDLFYMNARYRFGTDSNGRPFGMLTLGRSEAEGGLLGPLHARQFEIGDLLIPSQPLLSRSRIGHGVTLTDFPLPGQGRDDESRLEGRALPGSIVELYRDEVFLAAVRTDNNGAYEFEGLRLEPGMNDLRLVTIGPDGQIQEEQRTLYGGSSGPKPGQSRYRVTAANAGRTLLGSTAFSGGSGQVSQFTTEVQTGLTPGSWLSVTGARLDDSDYLGLGFNAWLGDTQFHARALSSDSGDGALSFSASRRMGATTVSLEHARVSGMIGNGDLPEIRAGASSSTRLRIDGMAGQRSRPVFYGFSLDRFEGLGASTDIRARVSGSSGLWYLSNNLSMRMSDGLVDASGLLLASKRMGTSFGRLEFGYGFGSNPLFQYARATIDRRLSSDYRVHYGIEDDVTRIHPLSLVGTVYRMAGPVAVGLNLNLDPGGVRASLLLSTGIGASSSSGRLALSRPGASAPGKVVVRAYLDKDLNGVYSRGDVLLPGIGIKVADHAAPYKTGKGGTCVLDRLAPDQAVALSLNEDTFEDPSWIQTKPMTRVLARPGTRTSVDFAVVETAEVEGKVSGAAELLRGHPGLAAELVDAEGQTKASSVLDSESSFVFSRVVPGTYTLRLTDVLGTVVAEQELAVAAGVTASNVQFKVDAATQTRRILPQKKLGVKNKPEGQPSAPRTQGKARRLSGAPVKWSKSLIEDWEDDLHRVRD